MLKNFIMIAIFGFLLSISACGGTTNVADEEVNCIQLPGAPLPKACAKP